MSKSKTIRLLCAGGGTGGHVFPIVALLRFIDDHSDDYASIQKIYRAGQSHGLEKTILEQQHFSTIAVRFLSLTSGKFRRQKTIKAFLQNAYDLMNLSRGVVQAIYYCKRHRINRIFSKGGYVALPIVIAAKLLRIPTIMHESDSRMGMTNRFTSNFAQYIYTAYPEVHPDAQVLTQLLAKDMTKTTTEKAFHELTGHHIDRHNTYVVVTGGSQGARTLYHALARSLESYEDTYKNMTFLIVGGVLNHDVQSHFAEIENCISLPFLDQKQLATLYYHSDIAITRGGSTSLAEQKLHKMLLCIVPLPRTHDQKANADHYVRMYGDIQINQDEQLAETLHKTFSVLQSYKKPQPRDDQLKDQVPKTPKAIADSIARFV